MKEVIASWVVLLSLVGVTQAANDDRMPQPYDAFSYEKPKLPHRPGRVSCEFIRGCHRCTFERAIDGDTLELNCGTDGPFIVRLAAIDAAETGSLAKCEKEKLWGQDAVRFLNDLLHHGMPVEVITSGKDKYNRWVGVVRADTTDVGAALVWSGNARLWQPKQPKPDWCAD